VLHPFEFGKTSTDWRNAATASNGRGIITFDLGNYFRRSLGEISLDGIVCGRFFRLLCNSFALPRSTSATASVVHVQRKWIVHSDGDTVASLVGWGQHPGLGELAGRHVTQLRQPVLDVEALGVVIYSKERG